MTGRDHSLGRRVAVTLAVALLVVAVWLPRSPPDEPLRVAVGIWPGAESLVLARERGRLPEDRFQFVEVTWASAAYRAFDNGVVDAAVLSLDGVLRLLESGEALRVIYMMDVSNGADAVLVREGMTAVADLRGGKVGVDVRGSGMYLLSAILESAGMTIADVEIVPLLQPEMEEAFQLGDVSAVVVSEPWMTGLRAKGARVLADSNSISPPIYRVLVVTERALEERRDDIVELLRAHLAMMPILRAGGTGKDLDSIHRREGLSRADFAASLERIRHLDVDENRSLLGAKVKGMSAIVAELDARMKSDQKRDRIAEKWIDGSIMEDAVKP